MMIQRLFRIHHCILICKIVPWGFQGLLSHFSYLSLFSNEFIYLLKNTNCSKSSFFVQKCNFDFPRILSIFLGWKTRENVVVLYFLAVNNFEFTSKIVKIIWVKNSWKCWGFCQNWICGQKFDFSNSVYQLYQVSQQVLDGNLTKSFYMSRKAKKIMKVSLHSN